MLKDVTIAEIDRFLQRYPELELLRTPLTESVECLAEMAGTHHKLMICGNGGSAADSLHIVGELMKNFSLDRKIDPVLRDKLAHLYPEDIAYYEKNLQRAIPAISLVGETALITAYNNDASATLVFAQQVAGYGTTGDVLLAISTSGNSDNVLHAAKVAQAMGITVISLTGECGGKLREVSDILLNVPATITHHIQEFHLPIYHVLCLALELEMFYKA